MFIEFLSSLMLLYLISKYFIDTKNIQKTFNRFKKENHKEIIVKNHPFIILNIPLYNEQKLVIETLKYYSKMEYPKGRLRINIITTEKEGRGAKSTYECVRKHIGKYCKVNFKHIHYPNKTGGKPHQINYALSKEKMQKKRDIFIGIYDVDSRPPLDTLSRLSHSFSKNKDAEVFQQFSLYFKDFSKQNYFSKATALFQSRWTLSYELPHCFSKIDGKSNTLLYTIGHGLFLNYNTYQELKGLPEETHIEDVAFGYRLSFLGKKILPLYNFDNCDVPTRLKDFFLQNASWYAGEQNILKNKDYVEKIAKRRIPIVKYLIPFVKRKFSVLSWGLGNVIYLITSLLNIYNSNSLLFLGLIVFGYMYSIRGISLITQNIKLLKDRSSDSLDYRPDILTCYLFIPIRSLVNSIGPQYYYFRLALEKASLLKSPYSGAK